MGLTPGKALNFVSLAELRIRSSKNGALNLILVN